MPGPRTRRRRRRPTSRSSGSSGSASPSWRPTGPGSATWPAGWPSWRTRRRPPPLPRAGLVELPSPELAVPKGWKLVKDAPTAEEKSLKEQEHFRAEADKTMSQRCQEKALADYPYRDGDTWFRCRLADGNLLPSIVLPAAEKASARARYSELCGVRSSEREVGADRLAGRPEFDWEKAERERLTKPKKKKGEDDE
jgi:hypothetical protein